MGHEDTLSSKNFLWLLVIGIIIAAIVILVLSRRDDAEPKETQDKNDRNLLPWAVGVGAVILVVGLAWYYGIFGSEERHESPKKATSGAARVTSTRGKSPQQVNEERLAQSTSRGKSPSAAPVSPPKAQMSASRSPPRGSLSSRGAAPL